MGCDGGETQRGKEREGERLLPPSQHLHRNNWNGMPLPSRADSRGTAGKAVSAHQLPTSLQESQTYLNTDLTSELQAYMLKCLLDIASWLLCQYLKSSMSKPVLATQFPPLRRRHHHHPWLSRSLCPPQARHLSRSFHSASEIGCKLISLPTSTAATLA